MSADVKALAGVMQASGSLLAAVKDGARLTLAGRRYLRDVDFSVQIIVEDRIEAGAAARAETAREIAAAHLQIGRSYRYREALKAGPARLIDALKAAVDSEQRMNPGSLGLPAGR